MKLAAEISPYIKGEAFSNKLSVRVGENTEVFDRIHFLCEYARNKNIIHVGCVDHLPLIAEKNKKQYLPL